MKSPFGNAPGAHLDIELLSSYLDRQVTPEERARVEQHLSVCAACQTELNGLRQTVAMLQSLPRVPVPRAFTLSEAQVGIRRSAAPVPWLGGLVRAAAALAAVALVAILGITLLRNPALMPTSEVARVAATPTQGSPEAMAAPAAAPKAAGAESPSPYGQVTEAPMAPSAPAQQPEDAADAARATVAQPAAQAALPTQAIPTDTVEAPAAKSAPEVAPTPSPAATGEAPMMALAAPDAATAEASEPLRGLWGRGGGGPAGAPITPEPAPPAAPLAQTLPPGATMAYANGQGLWTIESEGGARKLLDVRGAALPVVSDDREWIVYRLMDREYAEVWAVRWDGSDAHLLLNESDLQTEDLGDSYAERRIIHQDVRWVPGTHVLSMRIVAFPVGPEAPLMDEVWHLNVDTGEFRRILDLGVAGYFVYSPDGTHVAVLQRGNESQPQGSLSIYNSDGSGEHRALEFPANQFGFGYDSQVRWLPDGRSLLVAIPDPGADYGAPNAGITLYRVPVNGEVQKAGRISAASSYWAPDGSHLAYTQPVSGTMETVALVIANADGTQPKVYANIHLGTFAGWAPDSEHFLYQSNGQSYVGAVSQPPVPVPGLLEVLMARWVSPEQMLYLWDQGETWALVSYSIGGSPVSIATLPKDITYEVLPAE